MTTLRTMIRRMDKARDFPANTCPASRHAQQIAERLMLRVDMDADRTEHAGESIAATVTALWDARTKLATARREAIEECARMLDAEHAKRSHIDNYAAVYARMLRELD